MRGKWAQGIEPRHFTWVVKGRMAVCEQPGGYGSEYRKVRLSQELQWIRKQGFVVASLCSSPENMSSYAEAGVPCRHMPFAGGDDGPIGLARVLTALRGHLKAGDRLLVHREQYDEHLLGLMAAYLRWTRLVPSDHQALAIAEQLFGRELGRPARQIMALVEQCPLPGSDTPSGTPSGDD